MAGVAVKVTLVPAHIVVPGVEIVTVGVTLPALIVMVRAFDVALAVVRHEVRLLVNIHVTTSPLFRAPLLYVLEFVPTVTPFSFQTNVGVPPPLTGVAVKVTLCPEQIVVPGLALIVTDGVSGAVTFMVMLAEFSGLTEGHPALDVSWQYTTSPFDRPEVV